MEIIQKGYGEIRLLDSEELVGGEITVHAEGWVAFSPVPPDPEGERRWFPIHRISEITWKKSVAMRR